VEVRLNRAVVEHDVTLVVGPVFPHEVVGFSGGTKYLFPGSPVRRSSTCRTGWAP
jgi:nickel-dependent lactate racemase